MSFVKKAVKKVFKKVKKVVKKIWKPALIIGATLLTAGLAAPAGFAAFSGVSSLSGFMGAVGTTMAQGASAIVGGIGGMFGLGGAAAGTATTGGMSLTGLLSGKAALNAAGTAMATGLGNLGLAASGATLGIAGMGTTAATAATGGGIFSAIGGMVSNLAKSPAGAQMLFSGISNGIGAYMEEKERKRERRINRRRNFFGGRMRGGAFENATEVNFPDFVTGGDIPTTDAQNLGFASNTPQGGQAGSNYAQDPGLGSPDIDLGGFDPGYMDPDTNMGNSKNPLLGGYYA